MACYTVSFIAVLLCGMAVNKTLGENTTYVVALLGQDLHTDTLNNNIHYEAVITNSGDTSIEVTISDINGDVDKVNVPQNKKQNKPFNESCGLNGSEYTNKSLIFQSTDKFILQIFTIRFDYVEGLLGIPVEQMMGPHESEIYHYVVATFCATAGYCQLAIAAAKDETAVSITLPSSVDGIGICIGKSLFKTGQNTEITLNKFDAIQIETTQDLTGTVIYSAEPIAVFAGSRNVTNRDVVAHTMEQLVPSSHWGTEYIVQNLGTNDYGDMLKIVSRWTDTKVTMKGFSPLIIKNRHETVVRRLDKGMSSHIQASHPIQVIQITGLAYGTTNDTCTLSMTTVPSVNNYLQEPTTVACNGDVIEAQFHIVTEKLQSTSTYVNSDNYIDAIHIPYTKYMIGIIETTNLVYKLENRMSSSVGGIMKCNTATMPMGVLLQNVTHTTTTSATYDGGTCYEGRKASTTFGSNPAMPHTIYLGEYPDHILKLRVRACGEAVVQFFSNDGEMDESVMITLTHKQMTVTQCSPNCTNATTIIVPDNANFNDVDKFDCEVDMAFFWFRQISGDGLKFCFGIGANENRCDVEEHTFTLANLFTRVTLMGLLDDADFNWDFVHENGCANYVSDWRCADVWMNCSLYGTDFCSSDEHAGFVSEQCAKYCGKCFSDTYGRKFKIKFPYDVTNYIVIVSPLNALTHIAVTTSTTDVTQDNVVPVSAYDNDARYYTSSVRQSTYTLIADDDVSVTVLYSINQKFLTYRVYPVDTYGTEFMLLGYPGKAKKGLILTSEFDNVTITPYYTGTLVNSGQQLSYIDTEPIQLTSNQYFRTTGNSDINGYLFVCDKPCTVFHGDSIPTIAPDNYFLQQMSTDTWSVEYAIPDFGPNNINRSFDAKLICLANADNTYINISGGFDATIVIYNRGDSVEQNIDAAATYRITASHKIAVGIYLYDPADEDKSSFHIIAPMENYHDTIVTSVPNTMLYDNDFNVTDIYTYFVDANFTSSSVAKSTDDSSRVYRKVGLGDAKYGISVVQSNYTRWFVVLGNVKCKVIHLSKDICETSTVAVGDTIDNDCDGVIDEDICYKTYGVYQEDIDMDGAFGDDCSEERDSIRVVSKPDDPVCVVISRPPDQCWTVCSCKCSWVAKYEFQMNMTKDELVAAQQDAIAALTSTLEVETDTLTSATTKKVSAGDKRQSAANIGYVGVGLFALVFGTIIILDVTALLRDAKIFVANVREGFGRLCSCFKEQR